MDTQCKKCSADIDMMNCLYTVCEGRCAQKFHATCVGVTENDLCALSRNIVWICDDCMIVFCKARDSIAESFKDNGPDKNAITADLEELKSQIDGINNSFAKLSIAIASSSSSKSTQQQQLHSTPIDSPKPSSSVCMSEFLRSPIPIWDGTFSLLLTNIDRRVTESEIVSLVSQRLSAPEPECMDVTKLVPRWKNYDHLDYISFKIVLPQRLKLLAMTAATWPHGITFREFINRYKNPWKPSSMRNETV